MNKTLLLALLCTAAIPAFAQTAASAQASVRDGDASVSDAVATDRSDNRNCIRNTGSRITANSNARARKSGKAGRDCVNSPGRSYSQDDIQRTGETNVGDALRKLDPAIR